MSNIHSVKVLLSTSRKTNYFMFDPQSNSMSNIHTVEAGQPTYMLVNLETTVLVYYTSASQIKF